MALRPVNRLSAAAVGDDLHVVRVGVLGKRVRVRRGPVLKGFLSMSPDEARAALAGVAGAREVVLTCPSGMCGVRPMQLEFARWGTAKGEITRSIDRLFPLSSEEAAIGLVDAASSGGEGSGRAYLVAAARHDIQKWSGHLERALGHEVSEVLSSHMAMLGLGLQHDQRAGLIEATPAGEEIHWLRYGQVEELGAPWSSEMDDSTTLAGARLVRLPGAGDGGGVDELSGHDLAIGAALAPVVAGGRFAPVIGRTSTAPRRWLAPAAAAVAAGLLLWVAPGVREARYERALADLEVREAAMESDFTRIEGMRSELARLRGLMEDGVGSVAKGWRSPMPDLVAIHDVLPAGAYVYDVGVTESRATIAGEAPRASDVLRALEASSAFRDPRQESPTAPVPGGERERFDFSATRTAAGGSR